VEPVAAPPDATPDNTRAMLVELREGLRGILTLLDKGDTKIN